MAWRWPSSSRSARLPGHPALIMVAGGIAGGYTGAAMARRMDPRVRPWRGHGGGLGDDDLFLPAMKAMVLSRPGAGLAPVDRETPPALPGERARQGARVRRLPDGPPCRRRRAARRQAADRARTRDRRRRRAGRRRRRRFRDRAIASASRGSATRADSAAFCRERQGESLPRRAIHRLSARRRLRGVRGRRRPLRVQAARRLRRCRGGAAAVRRADRLSLVPNGRRRATPRPLRIRRGGAHHRAGGGARRRARSTRSRRQATRRRSSLRASLGAVWAGASTEPPPRPLDAAIIFAPVGALVPKRCRASRPAARSSAPAST